MTRLTNNSPENNERNVPTEFIEKKSVEDNQTLNEYLKDNTTGEKIKKLYDRFR